MWRKEVPQNTVPRLRLLQRLRRRQPGVLCGLEVLFEWGLSALTLSGAAYIGLVLVVSVQAFALDVYIKKYLSDAASLTLVVELPVLAHLLWFWREESAARAAPTQWVVYSWLHAAKVVVLFCKVMPRLPTSGEVDQMSIGGFSTAGVTFGDLFSPTNLTNLLLLTPVFYALLMFRLSKGIFGSFSNKITVDLLMLFDMLWHVVIDMVDQVDMFAYARLAEWVRKDVIVKYKATLTMIQTMIPFLLFLSLTLQAQSLPGVVVDRWKIPIFPDEVKQSRNSEVEQVEEEAENELVDAEAPPSPESPVLRDGDDISPSSVTPAARTTSTSSFKPLPPAPPQPRPRTASAGSVEVSGTEHGTGAASCFSRSLSSRRGRSQKRSASSGTFRKISLKVQEAGVPTERRRRRDLQAIIHHIQRQSIITARKRSAIISIFFIDFPFLLLRSALWILTLREGTSDFPALGVKNLICILLNGLQYPLVQMASKDAFVDIKRRLARYHCEFGPKETPTDGIANEVRPPVGGFDAPVMQTTPTFKHTSPEAREFREAEDRVRRETTKTTPVCVHFWAIFIAFFCGFLLAKGEYFFTQVPSTLESIWLHAFPPE